jgi:hypothetical protein
MGIQGKNPWEEEQIYKAIEAYNRAMAQQEMMRLTPREMVPPVIFGGVGSTSGTWGSSVPAGIGAMAHNAYLERMAALSGNPAWMNSKTGYGGLAATQRYADAEDRREERDRQETLNSRMRRATGMIDPYNNG